MQQDWAPDISVLPRITDATLEAFFAISDPSGRQREKAYRFAVEAYTEPSSVATQTSDTSSGIVHVRGTCFRSQKKTGLPYPVSVTFRAGDIAATACKCPAGKGGTCSHVLALLQLLMQLQKEGYKEPPPALSCTELPQQWRRPRQTGIAPASVQDVDWRRVCEGGSDVPRAVKRPASGSQRSESEVVASVRNLGGHLEVLGKCAFASVLLSSAGPLVPTKLGPAPSGSPAAYHQSRQLSGFTTWLVNIDPGTSRMLLVPGFQFPERDQYIFEEQHSERERAILDEISLCTEDACKLEQNTRQQSKSKTWGDARQHRLTASSFGKVLARQQWTERGLHNLLEPKDLTGVRAVQYGIKNEPLAVNRYVAVLKKLGHDVTVKHCGIFVDPSCPWLGATPDRLVFDPEEGSYGVVEVKCPHSLKDTAPDVAKTSKLSVRFSDNGDPRLSREHEHYFQLVGQMALTSCQWGDFVFFSEQWIVIERVRFESSVWEGMKPRLESFYFNDMLQYFCSRE